jgi:hypothetical protein
MERELPIYEIMGTEFLIDIEKNELRQLDNPENTISFNTMREWAKNYEFRYNPITKNLPAIGNAQLGIEVAIPQKVYLDPEGMSLKYQIPVAELKGKTDFEAMNDKLQLEKRLNGELPIINIAGSDYRVLVEERKLIQAEMPFQAIDLSKLQVAEDNESYIAYYQTPLKKVVDIQPGIMQLPKDVVGIHIPYELKLDPVGFARQHGLDEMAVLSFYPLQRELKAKVVSLAETELPYLVERNREQLKQNRGLRPGM